MVDYPAWNKEEQRLCFHWNMTLQQRPGHNSEAEWNSKESYVTDGMWISQRNAEYEANMWRCSLTIIKNTNKKKKINATKTSVACRHEYFPKIKLHWGVSAGSSDLGAEGQIEALSTFTCTVKSSCGCSSTKPFDWTTVLVPVCCISEGGQLIYWQTYVQLWY